MGGNRANRVRKGQLDYASELIARILIKALAHVSQKRLLQGYPQVAVFSFDYIAARVNVFGRYERDELDALIAFLRSQGLLRGSCIDVGANIGNHAIFFADYFSKVYAFEPSARPYALLSVNSGLKTNIQCYNVGLSTHPHSATLTAPVFNIGRGTIDHRISDTDATISSSVSLVSLDSIEELRGVEIGLMKIDVEGHELAVLDGAERTIALNEPVIVFEQQPWDIVRGSSAVIERLRALGYRNFWVISRSPKPWFNWLEIPVRVLLGESLSFLRASEFECREYSMIVATR